MAVIEPCEDGTYKSYEDLVAAVGIEQQEKRSKNLFYVKEAEGGAGTARMPEPDLSDLKTQALDPIEKCREFYALPEAAAEQAVLALLEMFINAESRAEIVRKARSEFDFGNADGNLTKTAKSGYLVAGFMGKLSKIMSAWEYPFKVAGAILKDYAIRYPATVLPVLERELSLDQPRTVDPIIRALIKVKHFEDAVLLKILNFCKSFLDQGRRPTVQNIAIETPCFSYMRAAGGLAFPYVVSLFKLSPHCRLPTIDESEQEWRSLKDLIFNACSRGDKKAQDVIFSALNEENLHISTMALEILNSLTIPLDERHPFDYDRAEG